MPESLCPTCGALTLPEDQFCETCGTTLSTGQMGNENEPGPLPCEKCGALPPQIDEEGFCSQCGFRQSPPALHRLEITLSPRLAGVSDRGLRHAHNEDHLALAYLEESGTAILVVCDGVSTSQHPELASKTVAEVVCHSLTQALGQGELPALAIEQAVAAALEAVCHIPYRPGKDADPPSTTLVAAVVQNQTATIAWLGDSRAYWFTADTAQQLTQDDSWMQEMVASGRLGLAEAQQAPQAHAITRWIGADNRDQATPSLVQVPLSEPGYLLLCTDGLWNYLPEVAQVAQQMPAIGAETVLPIAQSLVTFALAQGGHDNITVAILAYNPDRSPGAGTP